MTLDRTDLRMALVAVAYYRRAHVLSRRPVPEAADRLADRLEAALTASGPDSPVAQSDSELMTTQQVAQRLGCSTRHARRIAQRVGRRIGRQWLTPADALALPDHEEN